MGVIPVNENDKGFNFDGESSKTFDLIITGGAIFDAPERDVELIEIPGRNGAFVLDNNRFKNVTVTYECALSSTKEHEFVDAMRKVREWLCSKRGYCRLWDDFNPGEYRLGMFKGYIEVTNEAPVVGRFELSFDCKPQRFLLNGDNPVAVSDGGSIFNPTMFDAKPLLKADGYGGIGINGETVRIINGVVGDVILANATKLSYGYNRPHVAGENDVKYTIPSYIDGDVTVHGVRLTFTFNKGAEFTKLVSAGIHIDHVDDNYNNPPTATASGSCTSTKGTLTINVGNITMNGTTRNIVAMAVGSIDATRPNGITTSFNITVGLSISVKPTGIELGFVGGNNIPSTASSELKTYNVGEVTGYSSELAADGTVYIDLDVCEAYRPVASGIVDLNANVDIPAEPPALKPGANTITLDNTITELDIVPRWWEV